MKFLRQFLSMVFLRFPVYALAMKTHLLCVSAFALLLTGCSQFEELTSFPRVTREEPVAANNPEPMIAVPTSDDWCVRVAAGSFSRLITVLPLKKKSVSTPKTIRVNAKNYTFQPPKKNRVNAQTSACSHRFKPPHNRWSNFPMMGGRTSAYTDQTVA